MLNIIYRFMCRLNPLACHAIVKVKVALWVKKKRGMQALKLNDAQKQLGRYH